MDYYKVVLEKLKEWGLPESHSLAYGSTLLISLAPFLLLFLVRVENTPQHKNYLRVALSFASGGLLGDAFLHLIPHSMGHSHDEHSHDHADHHHDHSHDHHSHDHGHSHSHDHHHHEAHSHSHGEEGHNHLQQTYVGLYIVSGIVLFFLIEKLLHFLNGGNGHSHSHSHAPASKKGKKAKKAKVSDDEDSDSEELIKEKKGAKNQVSKSRFVSGLLNLIADFLHNFTDGLAIGATFANGKSMGAITAFTIFMHEIPHEIGDYAILIQAGYKRRNAMLLQLVTAIGALIGTAVGLRYGEMEHATQFILPVTAGGFIYIATVSVIPELLEKATGYLQSLMELIAMFAGLGMMFWIALNE